MIAYTKDGVPIISVLEIVPAETPVNPKSFDGDGDFYYSSNPLDLKEKERRPAVDDQGQRLFVDARGRAVPEEDLVYRSRGFLVSTSLEDHNREVYVDRLEYQLGPNPRPQQVFEALTHRLGQLPELTLDEEDSIDIDEIKPEDDKAKDPHHN